MSNHTNREHVVMTPLEELRYDDELDKEADKLGSYELGRIALGMPTEGVQAIEITSDLVSRSDTPRKPQRRRYVSGPQLGEDALPVPDQTRSSEEYEELRRQVTPVLGELEMRKIAKIRQKAEDEGINPDAYERAYHEKRSRDQQTRGK